MTTGSPLLMAVGTAAFMLTFFCGYCGYSSATGRQYFLFWLAAGALLMLSLLCSLAYVGINTTQLFSA